MINGSGIWIKVGDDSIGEYRTHYLGVVDTDNIRTWTELLGFLANSIEGLTTYHEERQQDHLPGMTPEDYESRKAQGWVFPGDTDHLGFTRSNSTSDLPL